MSPRIRGSRAMPSSFDASRSSARVRDATRPGDRRGRPEPPDQVIAVSVLPIKPFEVDFKWRGGLPLNGADSAEQLDLATYLAHATLLCKERVTWGGGHIHLELACYTTDRLPPVQYVTSVRCLLFNRDAILVERELDGVHILPGGRCEQGESLEQTLRREVLEETGWTIDAPRILGCLHFHHLSAKPAGHPFAYPDFLQPIFMAEAVDHVPDHRVDDDYVVDAEFRAISEVAQLPLPAGQQQLLATALRLRGEQTPGRSPRFKSGFRVREEAPPTGTAQ